MLRRRALSPAARQLLAILAAGGEAWLHGYNLCVQAGIKSGTLYPLLIRLEAQGFLEAMWQQPVARGRPPRHGYRLTQSGRQLARENPPLAGSAVAPHLSGSPA
ncbi:PadR family transcriptional regulator [Sphingomonas sp. RT2P30]|uniref:PadR family transcriptional regulator n=1 Tax=Parasphingomonas halimpatiens TaxID=3096162 RepID=UPI002FC60AC0